VNTDRALRAVATFDAFFGVGLGIYTHDSHPRTPHYMDEYQNKELAKWATRN
jgi:hypothetical protein